ncbi:RNA polymerase I-specific transcription initiation factor-domain-containing protein [Chaetomium sp. MPI-CAGE-AT-0009]|nr:RNA polymerase I-specific transcription initiation factor-domain-containing protein [Chaetomium sp. MPI-CAGE-AT-0009]
MHQPPPFSTSPIPTPTHLSHFHSYSPPHIKSEPDLDSDLDLNSNPDFNPNPAPNPSTNPNTNPNTNTDTNTDTDSDPESDSDHLHETRPNRWRGHPSTWKTWTERDRRAWLALENARKEDLAVHLYNAFALRKGLRVGPDVEQSAGEGGGGGEGWEPGKTWTAWPMRADEVPGDGLLPRTADVNEPFTFRRERGRGFAGGELEEEISATILRCAKERFWRRDLQGPRANEEVVVQSIETGDAATEGETDASDIAETTGQDEETDEPRRTPRRKRRAVSPTFTPVVSADDERSYALLRPATRRIMSRLDDALMILHNQRMAGLGNMSESSASDEDETDAEGLPERAPQVPPKPRKGGRPRKEQEQQSWQGPALGIGSFEGDFAGKFSASKI